MRTILFTTIIITLAASALAADEVCIGPGDVNADHVVSVGDLDTFGICMAGPEEPRPVGCDPARFDRADMQADDDVDLADFARLMPHVAQVYFDFGPAREDIEAELLAMELAGTLRAPDTEYARIQRDLALIRDKYPELADEPDSPDYSATQMLVGIDNSTDPGPEYDAMNSFYRLVDEEIHGTWRVLTFCGNLNMPVLADIYAALPDVAWADPNSLIGIDNYYTIEVMDTTYRYDIDDGFWDCFDGCDCHRHYIIDVAADGTVTLVQYEEYGWSWCEFSH